MKNLKIKTLLNAIAERGGDLAPSVEQPGQISPSSPETWNGDITRENLDSVFGLDRDNPSHASLLKWLLGLFGLGGPGDKECMRKLLKSQWFKLLRDFWMQTRDNHTPDGEAAVALTGATWVYKLAEEMWAAGCFKGFKLYEILEELLELNERAKKILRDGVRAAGQNLDKLRDAIGGALASKGAEYAQAYATAVALQSAGVGGAACSINISTGDVVGAALLIGVVAAAFFFAGPIGAAAALALSSCGLASASDIESVRERAKELNDRYLDIADQTEEYIDDVVDPTGLSNTDDFSEDGSLGNG